MSLSGEAAQPFEPPHAILLSGEGVRNLDAERLAMLSQMLGGLSISVTPLSAETAGNLQAALPEQDEQITWPVFVSLRDFHKYAEENGYRDRTAIATWNTLRRQWKTDDNLSFAKVGEDFCVDLQTVRERLLRHGDNPKAWQTTQFHLQREFMRGITTAHIGPLPEDVREAPEA